MELLLIAIGYIIGIIWGLYFDISIALFLLFIFVVYLYIKFINYKKNNSVNNKIKKQINDNFKKYLICFTIALIFSNIQINMLEKSFQVKYKNIQEEVEIVGTIVSEEKNEEYKKTYIVNVEKINENSSYKNTKILLNVKSSNSNIKYGNKIKINGNLEDASIAKNEGNFNYKEYLKTKGIYKIITAKISDIKIIKEDNVNFIFKIVNDIKNKIKENSKKILPEEEANFLIGILVGDKQELDKDIQENFKNSSLSHILAISGMHVSYLIDIICFILLKFKISKNKSKIITILFLLFFTLLTGASPSVERASIMSIYMIIGNLIHKKVNVINSISISALIILIINPYNLLDIGFQLSFGGTIGIVVLFPILKKYINIKNIKENSFFSIIFRIAVPLASLPAKFGSLWPAPIRWMDKGIIREFSLSNAFMYSMAKIVLGSLRMSILISVQSAIICAVALA